MSDFLDIESPYAEPFAAAGLRCLDDFMRLPAAADASSRHAHRETVSVEIALDGSPRRFFLKRVFRVPPRHAVAPLLRLSLPFSQPLYEWRMLAELETAGIPAMKRIACGERRAIGIPRQAFLLVEEVPLKATLEDWLIPGFSFSAALTEFVRRRLAFAVGAFIGRVHNAGFHWPDVDAKHVFAEPCHDVNDSGGWRFALIDVERMRRSTAQSIQGWKRDGTFPAEFRDDLCRLSRSLRTASITRFDLLRFFVGYSRAMTAEKTERVRRRAGSMAECAAPHAYAPRLPDDFAHPRATIAVRVGDINTSARFAELLRSSELGSIDDIFALRDAERLTKPGLDAFRSRLRVRLKDSKKRDCVCYLKRYSRLPLAEQLKYLWSQRSRGGPAKAESDYIRRLARIGVASMDEVAHGVERPGLFPSRSFIVTRAIEGESLEKLANRCVDNPNDRPLPRERHEIIRQLAFLVRRLHEEKFFHRDLYLCHIFLARNADGEIVLRLIDLARMIERPFLTRRWTINDLAALEYSSPAPLVTRADRLRFLYYYGRAADGRLSEFWLRQTMRQVRQRVRKMARHDRRRAVRFAES